MAAALDGKAVASLYELVKRKFSDKPDAAAALEMADGSDPDSPQVKELSEHLAQAEESDPEFSDALRAIWSAETVRQRVDRGGTANQSFGNVSGKMVQSRDIEGGVTF
jgi:hypothetical protein